MLRSQWISLLLALADVTSMTVIYFGLCSWDVNQAIAHITDPYDFEISIVGKWLTHCCPWGLFFVGLL